MFSKLKQYIYTKLNIADNEELSLKELEETVTDEIKELSRIKCRKLAMVFQMFITIINLVM